MRPETARRLINGAFNTYLNGSKDALYYESTMRALQKMQAKHFIWNHEHGYPQSEYVPNIETDYKGIEGEMFYISDRWNAQHRLAWIITGIEEHLL